MRVCSVGVCVVDRSSAELPPRASDPRYGDFHSISEGRPKRSLTPGVFGSKLIVKSLLLAGVSTLAMSAAGEALAQQAQLPPLVVEGNQAKPKKKVAAPKKSSAPVATAPVAMPPQQPSVAKVDAKPTSETPYSVPAGVSVVTAEELNTFGNGNIDDALRSQPGTFTRVSPQNAGLAVNIRGFEGSGRVNTTIDGARQNFRFTGHEAQGFTYIDPSLIAGVDIQRGAVSTAGGAGALAGAADLRTLDVQDILLPGQTVGGLVSTTWGTNGQRFTGLGAAAAQSAGVGIAGAVGRRNPTDYENGDGVTVPLTFQDLYSGLFKANFQINEENSLRFGGVFYNNDFFANSYYQNVTSNTFTAKYAYKPVDNDLIDFKLNGYRNEVTMRYGTDATPTTRSAFESASTPVQGSAWGRVIDDEGWGFDVSNVSRFNLGSVRVRSEYGYEYFRDDVDAYNRFQSTAQGGVNPSGVSSIGGVFSQTTFSQGIFDFIAGLRYDTYTLQGSGTMMAGSPPAFVPYTVDRSDGGFSPKFTLSAKPYEWFQPYVTYSQSFRAPTISETLAGGSHPGAATFAFAPNPFLDPEKQKGWEFGFNSVYGGLLTRGDTFRLKADYYTMDVEDYITACAGAGGTVSFCNTAGTTNVQGVELQSMYDAGIVFAGASYTYTNPDLPAQTAGFGAPNYIPEHTAVGSLGVRLIDRKLTLGTRVSYFSETDVGLINTISQGQPAPYASRYMPGYTVVDLFSNYKVSQNLDLGLNVTNLFDEDYTPAPSTTFTSPAGQCFGSNAPGCNTTGMGRTFYVTARSQF
jgi:hemoglobin/transferrin/lactoferrin receptor protein